MFPRLRLLALHLCLASGLTGALLAQAVVSQDGRGDFNGADEKPILAAIASVRDQGGGEIVLQRGIYTIHRSIELKGVANITLRGMPGATLKLAPLQYAEVSRDVAVGETELPVRIQQGITAETLIQVQAPGAVDTFSGKAKPTFFSKLAKVEKDSLILAAPLVYPVPAKTLVTNENAPNLFEVRDGAEGIVIESLIIDGGKVPGDPDVRAHAQACGIFGSGKYNYTDGPTGKPVRALTIRDCTIRNCFGRGVALYAVTDALVAHCRIEDTADEAVDLDHFTVNCRVLDNQIARCRVGVELNDANECWVERNRFDTCETGVIIWRWCKMDDLNVRNHVVDNLIVNVAGNGMQFEPGTRGNIARGNIIRGAGRNGVSLGANDTIVTGNIIERTAMHGIVVAGDGNTISGNRVSESGAGATQKFSGVRVRGSRNALLDNAVAPGAEGTPAVADDGKDNVVR